MSIRQSVLGEVAIRNGLEVSGADIEGLLRRLLLYETVTIRSVRLRELPYIVRAFGKDGFLQLLNSGVLKISCEFSAIISPLAKNGIRVLPYGHFTFGMADITDRVGVLGVELRNLQSVSGLKIADRSVIETTVLNKLVRPPSNYMQQLLDQVEIDLRSGTPALQIAIEKQVKTRFGDSAPALAINVEEVEKRTFRIGNNIPELFGISDEISDQILRLAVSAVTHLNHRVAEMSAYSAITGFEESESNLLFGKFAGILRPLNPNLQEDQFTRVATIAGFPELIAGKRVDVERLLTVRDSAELREFRDWLSKLDSLSDEQIREMLNSVRQRIGSFARSGVGKTLRLAVTSAVGLVGVLPGLAAGAFDTFLVEKLFPNSGVVAFLTKSYPSLFDSP